MMATNHALTGAAIGLTVSTPAAALPLAVVSHFALDAVPHYGSSRESIHTVRFRNLLLVDALLCLCLVIILVLVHPRHWLVAVTCAFLATSPDFMWVGKFLRARHGQIASPMRNLAMRFHGKIQWFQRPIGVIVECVWAFAAVDVLAHLIR
jgi:hypothetical protein